MYLKDLSSTKVFNSLSTPKLHVNRVEKNRRGLNLHFILVVKLRINREAKKGGIHPHFILVIKSRLNIVTKKEEGVNSHLVLVIQYGR